MASSRACTSSHAFVLALQQMITPPHMQRDFVRKRGAAAASAPPRLPPADGGTSSSAPGSSRSAGGNASAAGAAAGSAAAEVVPAVPGGAAVGSDGEEERRLLEGMELVMRTVSYCKVSIHHCVVYPLQLCACARLGKAGPALRPSMRPGRACARAQLEGRGCPALSAPGHRLPSQAEMKIFEATRCP